MYIYIHLYICIHTYTHICIHTYLYICIHTYRCVYMHMHNTALHFFCRNFWYSQVSHIDTCTHTPHSRAFIYKYAYIYIYIYIYVYIYICIYVYTFIYIYMDINTYIYTRTHSHIHTYNRALRIFAAIIGISKYSCVEPPCVCNGHRHISFPAAKLGATRP